MFARPREHREDALCAASLPPRWSSASWSKPLRPPASCGATPSCRSRLRLWMSLPLLRLLAGAGSGRTLARDGFHPRNIFLKATDLLQTLRLSHVELELQAEELVVELALLMLELVVGQVANFFRFHDQFLSSLCGEAVAPTSEHNHL